jgi:phosphoribosylformimino-5-aminoimidazole carboxamide ribotide isomerase
MDEWWIYPAIDLRRGQVVRLKQGDPSAETRYSNDPQKMAQSWLKAGADWLHVINLDGALSEPDADNLQALHAILETGARVQFGGGVRSLTAIDELVQLGVERVILSTAAILDSEFLKDALTTFGEQIILSLDVKRGELAVRGWQESHAISPLEMARGAQTLGLSRLIVTDTHRDGLGMGLNLTLSQQLQMDTGLRVIAAGGARSLDDVQKARQLGLAGVILGRAIYEGQIELQEALRC